MPSEITKAIYLAEKVYKVNTENILPKALVTHDILEALTTFKKQSR